MQLSAERLGPLIRGLETPAALVAMFAAAFLIRAAIAQQLGFFSDLQFFQTWSMELRAVGTHAFYASDPYADYPPGYLYVLWVIGKLSASPGYLLLKLPSILADLWLAWIAGTLAARLAPGTVTERLPVRALVAAAVLFNPAVIALSAGWGQVDVIPVCFVLGSLLLLFTGKQTLRREIVAALMFGVAFSMKPQTCLAFPVIAYALYLRYFRHRQQRELLDGALRIVLLGACSLGVWVVSGFAFGLGPAGLLEVYRRAGNVHPVTSANAFNFWGLLGFWRADSTGDAVMKVAGLPAAQFGLLVFAASVVYVVWQVHRAIGRGLDERRVLVVGAVALSLLGFTLLTRMHERYLFLALACLAPLVFERSFRLTYIALSGLFLLNLWYPYAGYNSQHNVQALLFEPWFDWIFGGFSVDSWQRKVLSLTVTATSLIVAWRGMRWLEKLGPSTAVMPLSSPADDAVPVVASPGERASPDGAMARLGLGGLARWAPLALVGLSCLFGLVILKGELRYADNLNDSALHLLMVKWASIQLHEGRLPLDGWFPYFSLGSSFFHHYQSLPHTLTALLANMSGASDQTVYLWMQYLLLALWPVVVYVSARLLGWNKWTAACAAAVSPLLASAPGYGFEHGSYIWRGFGVYSQEWGMWFLPLAWGLTWRAVTLGKHYAAAALALALTVACHFITGYLALLTVGVWVIVIGRAGFLQRILRAAIVTGGSLLIAAWVVVPLLTDMKYSAQSEYYKGSIFSDSYGAPKVLDWLVRGQLFDLDRVPVVTLLFVVGVVVCALRARHDTRARALLGAFTLSLLLFFGRPTFGPVLNLLPGFGDVQIHRFLMGVELAAIFLAGVGLEWLVRKTHALAMRFAAGSAAIAGAAALVLGVGVLTPALIERSRDAETGSGMISSQLSSSATDGRDLDSLVAIVRDRRDGRVYAGMRGNWGQQYRVGSVPVHAWLANREIDAIGFSFRTVTSLSTDIEVAFDENNPAQYEMLNVRYVILPPEQSPRVPATLIAQSGRHRLFDVKTSGYFQVVDREAPVTADRMNIETATRAFRNSDLALRSVYPGVAFAGARVPAASFVGASPPSGSPGEVLAQTTTLADGVFNAAVNANRQAVLLLKATYDPRWTATVDGRAAKPMMIAPSLVGVDVPSGIHNVEFRYKPYGGYPLLLAIGALTLIALIVIPRRVTGRRWMFSARIKVEPREAQPYPPAATVKPVAPMRAAFLPPGRVPSRRVLFAVAFGSMALFLVAYSNSLHNSFHFDDSSVIVDNLFIRDVRNIPHFFTDARTYSANSVNDVYRPLVTTTFAIDYWLGGGLDPLQFHITQLALLIFTGILLYVLYVSLFASTGVKGPAYWAALFAATLFCVHIANTETGNWMNARSELLSGLGVLAAFVMYIHGQRLRRYHIYLIPVVVGAFAKTPVVMFAPLLLGYKLLIEEQLSVRQMFSSDAWPDVRRSLLAAGPAFVLGLVLFVFMEKMNAPTLSWGGLPRGQYLLTQTWVWVRYARLFFIPSGLTADTDLAAFTTALDWRVAAGVALFIVSLVAFYKSSRERKLRPVAFGIAWFWIALIPTSTVFPLSELTNDYRVFFPFMGLTAAVVWWVALQVVAGKLRDLTGSRLPQLVALAAMIILVVNAVGTFRRNRVWRNEETLWQDVVTKSPHNGRGLMNYGLTQMEKGNLGVARDYFTRSYAIDPHYLYVDINLAIVSDAMGDTAAAEQWFDRALNVDPNSPATLQFFARWLSQHGRAPEAIERLQRAIELSPAALDAREALLGLYAARDDNSSLTRLARQTLQLAGGDSAARSYLATSVSPPPGTSAEWYGRAQDYSNRGLLSQAAYAYRVATRLDSANADAWNNLGWILNRLGFYSEAVSPLEHALAVRSDFTVARNNLTFAKAHIAEHDR